MSIPALEVTVEPAAVRAARWTAWLALAGASVQFGAMLGVFVTQALSPSIGGAASAPGESVIFLTVVAVILVVPALVAFAAIRAANGRPAGRSVLWTFGPLAVALSGLMLAGAVDQLSHSWNRIGPIFLMLVLVPVGTLLFTVPITVSAVLWLLPAARADLAEYRDENRGSLGRALVSTAAGLLGATVLFAVGTAVLMSFAPQETPSDDLTRATVAAGVTAVAAILLLGGVVLTRLTGRRAVRGAAYGLGTLLMVWQFAAVTLVALGVRAAAGDSAVFYAWTAVVIFSIGAVLHLVALLLLSLPAVSTWLDDCLELGTGG